ncbi:MAG: SWF/SNF helicase family protein, partial [Gammaproteobacteria bacterium]|nr:SWF/SNF helicase family protein [Gammaproteobacteria bacterium]
STYLLDGKTDHGNKCEELVTLLRELLEQPAVKVVIFSQWLRTHELIVRRLEPKRWGHVLFHGGVPGARRGALVERFHKDPGCRVFLSTDAGGVGLNLQAAASVVINMDLPWNPAVLEQRIGRVHRLGQTRGVQVVNFVARGAIEEGMLSVLAFKKSLFAGVLDGGPSEVFLGGSRLRRFMESVEAVTAVATADSPSAAPPASVQARLPARNAITTDHARSTEKSGKPAGGQPSVDSWASLLTAGLKLVESLASASSGNGNGAAGTTPSWLTTDAATGRSYVKLPVPEPQVLQALGAALSRLASGLIK